ncbi:hypothetical protein [Clostridium beijerinckii]|uniref:hypothetical protein n=1 Tax=Clostridium beijerinckii TaxID=1520 RepID=UPI001494EEA7|nr:hypothetical protein [Clostridium beijerinckii]NOW07880.1 hypothetical protein [Clostridium beijerinckii]NYC05438.1 hypothetical protein [Clostridium beijerinckii]NYC05511.1 hypothetical protein [Clostridium beijerinckii]
MFNLDLQIFNFIYSNCKHLGGAFGYGAFEGFVLYGSVIALAIVKVTDSNVNKEHK